MHLHFERVEKPSSYCDCSISSLSWMGKVPDTKQDSPVTSPTHPPLPENQLHPPQRRRSSTEDGWKLNRSQYYGDGWLATGNARGIVGVTFTTCRCMKSSSSELPPRTNFNLRGHRSEVTIVKWNEPYQKLATCDSSGVIFVWIKYEGRWSIELIHDRNTQVTDFNWSHDGRMALICYTDGFVLVGSVTGQRYWSSMLNLEANCVTTCGVWSPDDSLVFFGTSNGQIVVIQVNGTVLTQVPVRPNVCISSLGLSCEKFKMDDSASVPRQDVMNGSSRNGRWPTPSADPQPSTSSSFDEDEKKFTLCVTFVDGVIYLLKSYDDIFPVRISTGLESLHVQWSNHGDVLAVSGHVKFLHPKYQQAVNRSSSSILSATNQCYLQGKVSATCLYMNQIKFYTETGSLRYQVDLAFTLNPITALTWGHNDKRIFIASGPVLHIAWVTKKVPSLQLLSRLRIFKSISSESNIERLHLPSRLSLMVSSLFSRTLRCYLPSPANLVKFIYAPPEDNIRVHCTLIRHDDDLIGGSTTYVLYLEYLGGLVPILKGKRASKLKPEFIIYDPTTVPKENTAVTSTPNKEKKQKETKVKRNASQSNLANIISTSLRQSSNFVSNSVPNTPLLGRRRKNKNVTNQQQSLYWDDNSSASAANSASDSETDNCYSNFYHSVAAPQDSYGHVYSLPSPMMRRRCRRKRRGASSGTDGAGSDAEGHESLIPVVGTAAHNDPGNEENPNSEATISATITGFIKPESTYTDEMPESNKLLLITSNIWGTKFKILSLVDWLPATMGTVLYRTSLLHLQPRQMTLQIKELGGRRNSLTSLASPVKKEQNFNNSVTRHNDRMIASSEEDDDDECYQQAIANSNFCPVAPMTPIKNVRRNVQRQRSSPDRLGAAMQRYQELQLRSQKSMLRESVSGRKEFQSGSCHRSNSEDGEQSSIQTKQVTGGQVSNCLNLIPDLKLESLAQPSIDSAAKNSSCSSVAFKQSSNKKDHPPSLDLNCEWPVPPRRQRHSRSKSIDLTFASASDQDSSPLINSQDSEQINTGTNVFDASLTNEEILSQIAHKFATELSLLSNQSPVKSSLEKQVAESNRMEVSHEKKTEALDWVTMAQVDTRSAESEIDESSITFDGRMFSISAPCEASSSSSSHPLQYYSSSSGYSSSANNSLDDVISKSNPPTSSRFETHATLTALQPHCSRESTHKNWPHRRESYPLNRQPFNEHFFDGHDHAPGKRRSLAAGHRLQSASYQKMKSLIDQHQMLANKQRQTLTIASHQSRPSDLDSPVTPAATLTDMKFIDDHEDGTEHIPPPPPAPSCSNLNLNFSLEEEIPGCLLGSTNGEFKNIRSSEAAANADDLSRLTLKIASRNHKAEKSHHMKCTSLELSREDEEDDGSAEDCVRSCDCGLDREDDQRVEVKAVSRMSCGQEMSRNAIDTLTESIPSSPIHVRRRVSLEQQQNWNRNNNVESYLRIDSIMSLNHEQGHVNRVLMTSDDEEDDVNESRELRTSRIPRNRTPMSRLFTVFGRRSGSNENRHGELSIEVGSSANSLPASPLNGRKRVSGRRLFYSPLMIRKVVKQKLNYLDCSSEDDEREETREENFRGIRTFQKEKMRKRRRGSSRVQPDDTASSPMKEKTETYREFVLQNKAPFWNELSQVYQLDFGGRVTQESAKNFQIEHQGNQVMQFGRIDGNAYTLDFQYPFSALQALAVALANVTQRLK